MIEVGKIVLAAASRKIGTSPLREEYISVKMDEDGIYLDVNDDGPLVRVPHQKALDLGQMLLKAVEAQQEYAVAAKELNDQKAKLDARYRDLISGLGLEALVDRLDENGGLKPQVVNCVEVVGK